MAASVVSLRSNEDLIGENEEDQSRTNGTVGDEDEYQSDAFNSESLQARLIRPLSSCSSGANPPVDKTACLSDKMVRLSRRKAEIRARRSEDPSNPMRLKAFKDHRFRIKTAKAQVDSSNPMEGKIPYQNHHYSQRLTNFARVERENAIMLRHLAEIIHGRGTFDTRWSPTTKFVQYRDQSRQLRLLKITFENLSLLKRIQSQRPFYSRRRQLEEYSRHEEVMEKMSLYPLFWHLDKECKWGPYEMKARENARLNPRPRCFLALGNAEQFFGKITIELYAKECPITAENFRGLCTGGDVTGQDGSGSKSAFGDHFPDENFIFKHDKPGVLSMANSGPNTNGSQFMIAAKRLSVLDGTNVVFGQVINGMSILQKLFNEVTSSGRPKKKVFIVECGELDANEDSSPEDERDTEDSEGIDEAANLEFSDQLTDGNQEEPPVA
ncbi:unnamed protein product [Allacma fusca]|uniref:PPIase cyclophilin-type domain-containing protein n=1 Tax=Allacma fusca TaxID=39272 RepID=A0A8J2LQU9_9HEXA|nr:unnamed protein product [Allacma fusca]